MRGYVMNEFTRKESELVEDILQKIGEAACNGVVNYADINDWSAAATAVIQLVKERLNAEV